MNAAHLEKIIDALKKGQPVIANVNIIGARILSKQEAPITVHSVQLHSCDIHTPGPGGLVVLGEDNAVISSILQTQSSPYTYLNSIEAESLW